VLDRLLSKLPRSLDPNLLVGLSTADDAGVYRLSEELALVQTLDFFTPIVDDPYDYGRIAAANSLSDIYAMGGKPITAMNILAFPITALDEEVMLKILEGGAAICEEAGVTLVGGHSITDKELKYGLSVTGLIHPERIITNSQAKVGDILLLTKPLGSGLICNAMMNDAAKPEDVRNSTEVMVELNRLASEIAVQNDAHSMTDITGYGLLGHSLEMAKASNVCLRLDTAKLPVLPGAQEIAESNSYYSGGERRNLKFVTPFLSKADSVSDSTMRILSDPQTSGGLLIAVDPVAAEKIEEKMKTAKKQVWRVGECDERRGAFIEVFSSAFAIR